MKARNQTGYKEQERQKINEQLEKFLKSGKEIIKEDNPYGSKYYIYYLIDPNTNEVFYIGKGSRDRMYDHEKLARQKIASNNNYDLYNRIRLILESGKKIIYKKVWFTWNEFKAYEKEKQFIERKGLSNLTNIMPGGKSNK